VIYFILQNDTDELGSSFNYEQNNDILTTLDIIQDTQIQNIQEIFSEPL
jgi:hypothetical protein